MHIERFVCNPVEENAYAVSDEVSRECILIDAGFLGATEQQRIRDYIVDNHLKITHLLNTHLHLDHIFGNHFIRQTFGVGPEASAKDEKLISLMHAHANVFGIPCSEEIEPLQGYVEDGDELSLGNLRFQVIGVPGHTEGGLAFYQPDNQVVFVGDSLFKGSIGRTDLPGGDYPTLIDSLQHQILCLPDDTVVYCGHGSTTTIREEKVHNPYLSSAWNIQ